MNSVQCLRQQSTSFAWLQLPTWLTDGRPAALGSHEQSRLHVQLLEPTSWTHAINDLADLLCWLTGDSWELELAREDADRSTAEPQEVEPVGTVALLSGGLDSYCGAVIAGPEDRLFVGHWDNSTVKGVQNAVARWMSYAFGTTFKYEQIRVAQAEKKREPSSRSRSLLFMALAVAIADARGAPSVEIPENGYTSLNPPLGPERGGALSTRSTHPSTIARFNGILAAVRLDVAATVPHSDLTKGQLVALAEAQGLPGFQDGVAATLSCGKLDGRTYRGGNPNHHCGLCYPCIVRRGGILAAAVDDTTPYLSETLSGAALSRLHRNRASDIEAVRRAVASGFTDELLLSMASFPEEHDLDQAADLCEAGLAELSNVVLD